jgi:dienelactone hydrolase
MAKGKGFSAAFAAHPAAVEDDDITSINGPTSIAFAQSDMLTTAARRNNMTALLESVEQPFTADLYGGTSHGFAVRANMSNPQEAYGKETAFLQALRWFDVWA